MKNTTSSPLRRCLTCNIEKPVEEFYVKRDLKRGWTGYSSNCKQCNHSYQKSRDAHYLLKAQLNSRKRDAEKHGVPFSIGLEDLLPVPTACPILGIELKHGETGGSDNSPSIDRIRPELGYVKGNVAVISMKANRIKNDATADELLRVYEWLKEKTNEGKEH